MLKCNQLRFSVDEVITLGRCVHALQLSDEEMSKMKALHTYMLYVSSSCDGLKEKTFQLATDREYSQYFVAIPHNLTSEQIVRMRNPSHLQTAIKVSDGHLDNLHKILFINEVDDAFEVTEMKKVKIAREILTLFAAIKEEQLGIITAAELSKIKDDFLGYVAKYAQDLLNYVDNSLKLDKIFRQAKEEVISMVRAQRRIPLELAFSFLI